MRNLHFICERIIVNSQSTLPLNFLLLYSLVTAIALVSLVVKNIVRFTMATDVDSILQG